MTSPLATDSPNYQALLGQQARIRLSKEANAELLRYFIVLICGHISAWQAWIISSRLQQKHFCIKFRGAVACKLTHHGNCKKMVYIAKQVQIKSPPNGVDDDLIHFYFQQGIWMLERCNGDSKIYDAINLYQRSVLIIFQKRWFEPWDCISVQLVQIAHL